MDKMAPGWCFLQLSGDLPGNFVTLWSQWVICDKHEKPSHIVIYVIFCKTITTSKSTFEGQLTGCLPFL